MINTIHYVKVDLWTYYDVVMAYQQHQNQFFICDSSFCPTPPGGFYHTKYTKDLNIYHSKLLPFYHVSNEDCKIALIGDAVIPDGPPIQKWLKDTISESLKDVLYHSQKLTGRYTILYSNESSTTVIPDPLAHKSLYFHTGHNLVTSSLKLLLDSIKLDFGKRPSVNEFVGTDQFRNNESAFVGDKTVFQSVNRVLPNHILDISEMYTFRRPLFLPDIHQNPGSYIADNISSTVQSFNDRHELLVALTAGWDSRTILSCSKSVVQDISWFTFSHQFDKKHPDVKISQQIASECDFDYSIYYPKTLKDDFQSALDAYLCRPRSLPKTRNIQFLHDNFDPSETIYLTGNGGEILRSYYEPPDDGENLIQYLCNVLQYPNSDFVRTEIEDWLPDAAEYAQKYDIPLMDLLYWEQRMGRWGALAPREKDIAIRGISPFSNYELLLAGLDVPRNQRTPPEHELFRNIIGSKWPALLEYRFNPSESRLKAAVINRAPNPVKQLLRFGYSKIN
jgi:hypothetical protein